MVPTALSGDQTLRRAGSPAVNRNRHRFAQQGFGGRSRPPHSADETITNDELKVVGVGHRGHWDPIQFSHRDFGRGAGHVPRLPHERESTHWASRPWPGPKKMTSPWGSTSSGAQMTWDNSTLCSRQSRFVGSGRWLQRTVHSGEWTGLPTLTQRPRRSLTKFDQPVEGGVRRCGAAQ